MPVYVDKLRACVPNCNWRWERSCHLFADEPAELHAFARRLGLRREWFQHKPRKLPHYDLLAGKRAQAVELGAIEVDDITLAGFCYVARNER